MDKARFAGSRHTGDERLVESPDADPVLPLNGYHDGYGNGFKVFRFEVLEQIEIQEVRFEFEPEITAKIARLNCHMYEVGISYHGRTYQEGKKITWKDGVKTLWYILKYNLFQRNPRTK